MHKRTSSLLSPSQWLPAGPHRGSSGRTEVTTVWVQPPIPYPPLKEHSYYRSRSNYPNDQKQYCYFHHRSMLNRKQNNCPRVMFQCITAVFRVVVLTFFAKMLSNTWCSRSTLHVEPTDSRERELGAFFIVHLSTYAPCSVKWNDWENLKNYVQEIRIIRATTVIQI